MGNKGQMKEILSADEHVISSKIFTIRGVQVMIDKDLAELYGIETKVFNQAVKRNIKRFPEKFRFQLVEDEKNKLVTNCDRFKPLKYSTSLPYAFSEQGVSMLSAVLNSNTAIEVSIKIIDSFVTMRKFLMHNASIFQRLENVEQKLLQHNDHFEKIFKAIEAREVQPKQGIFYDGQIFDAYVFVSELIKRAKHSIVLFDNYIDESVLLLLSKRIVTCKAIIFTKTITKTLELDLKKLSAQYPRIEIKVFDLSHDRFLLIDDDIYHIGASLKDLGKKWFGFSKMDKASFEIMQRVSFTH